MTSHLDPFVRQEKPEKFAPCTERLFATVPQNTIRYDVQRRIGRSHATVAPPLDLAKHLPGQWRSVIHPEGNTYFYEEHPLGLVITDSWIYTNEIESKVSLWADFIIQLFGKSQLVPRPFLELYLRVDSDCCMYYFVDGSTRALFWLDPVFSIDLGLPGVVSQTHSGLLLESQFWSHVEHFPQHSKYITLPEIDNLIAILLHGLGDQLTSRCSTFPYDVENCRRIIKLLKDCRGYAATPYVTTTVARFYHFITYNRYEAHYAEEQARLSRDTGILPSPSHDSFTAKFWRSWSSQITFGAPTMHRTKLEGAYVDEIVYEYDWTKFVADSTSEWRRVLIVAGVMIFVPLVFSAVYGPSHLSYAASGLAATSVAASAFMINRFVDLQGSSAATGREFLSSSYSERFNFDITALIHAIPRTLLYWSAFFLINQIIVSALFTHSGIDLSSSTYLALLYFLVFSIVYSLIGAAGGFNSIRHLARACFRRNGRVELSSAV